ncbi:MAG: DUF126 domain-containing protein [Ignisphaera sp.]
MFSRYCMKLENDIMNTIEGEVVKVSVISFLGDIDREKGTIISKDSGCFGCSIKNKILVVERFRGSTVGTYVLYSLCRKGLAPKAIISIEPDPVVVAGAALCGIPLIYGISENFLSSISTDDKIRIEMDKGANEVCIVVEKDFL